MVQFHIHIVPDQRKAYIPKVVVESLGNDLVLMSSSNAALLFPQNGNLDAVVKSVQLILAEISLEKEKKAKK